MQKAKESLILNLVKQDLLEEFIDLLLTKEEHSHITNRLVIIKELLLKEKSQRQIAKDFSVSIAQITRGSNQLKNISPSLTQFLKDNIENLE